MPTSVANRNEEKQYLLKASFDEINKIIKSGSLVRTNEALDFLMLSSSREHFNLYIPVSKNTILFVLRPFMYCGDWRYEPQDLLSAERLEETKNLHLSEIVTPVTPCCELLCDKDIIYIECSFFQEFIKRNWVEVIAL